MADYRDNKFNATGPGEKPLAPRAGGYWWQEDESSKAHQRVMAAVRYLENVQAFRTADNLRHARLYGNFDSAGFGLRDYSQSASFAPAINRIALNVIAACVDTLAAKIGKNRPRPSFQTFGGNWDNRVKAKALDKFCQGKFYELKMYEIGARTFVDSLVFGTGVKKFFERDGRVCCERVMPDELRVDDADGIHGTPRQLFQTKFVAREVLAASFGTGSTVEEKEIADAIAKAKGPDASLTVTRGFGDMVQVVEAWHLPSSKGAKDGKHVIAIDGATLDENPWGKDYFPFTFERFAPRLVGFWGQGLAERLTGIQIEINRILRDISEALRLVSKPRFMVEGGSGVVKAHINNDVGTILTFNGTRPMVDSSNAVPPEQFAQLDRLYARAFEECGISQLSATQQKPAGLDSGAALREYGDTQSERFALVSQAKETSYMDDARIIIDMTRDIFLRTGSYEVSVPGRKYLETIDWKEIDLPEDEYVMQIFPVSSLPTTPAARTATVQEWIQAGFVDQVEGRRLLDFPDLEQSTNLAVAAMDDVDATVDAALMHGELMPIEEYQDLHLLIQRGTAALLKARHEECPQKNLDVLQELLNQAAEMLEAPPNAGPSPGADQAAALSQGAAPGQPAFGPDAPAAAGNPVAPPVLQ